MDPKEEIGFWLHRDEILHQLYEWGYNVTLMSAWDVNETGYWSYVRKDKYLMVDESGENLIRHHTSWLSPKHYQWLVTTVEDIGGRRIEVNPDERENND